MSIVEGLIQECLEAMTDTFIQESRLIGSLVAFLAVVALIGLALYRLHLSPLARYPGPKLAALTGAYQFYFDVVKRGALPWEIKRLHEKYGPVVRITPWEVHVSDPDFYDVLYASAARRRHKVIFAANGFGLSKSLFAAADHDLHRLRRSALNPFFSRQAVDRLGTLINSKIDLFCNALREAQQTKEPVDMDIAITALVTDIISSYSVGKSYGLLERPGFAPEWSKVLVGAAESSNFFRYQPWLIEMLQELPQWIVEKMDPNMTQLIRVKADQKSQIERIKTDRARGEGKPTQRTIFHELLDNDELPPAEKSDKHLQEAAQILLAAGIVTTNHFLKSCLFYILADPAVKERLAHELKQAIPSPQDSPPLHDLEKLPYLSAVVKEASRLCDGASSRLTRIAPDEDLTVNGWVIERGTPVSMSTYIQHRDPSIFPDPDRFNPERWLDPKTSAKCEKYLVNFSKGARACLGINLAKAEQYTVIAALFRRFEFELFETDLSDVVMAHDFFVPYARTDSKGVRVLVKNCVDS